MAEKKDTGTNTVEKELTGEEKYRLFNVHLQDKVLQLEKDLAQRESVIAKLKLDNAELRTQIHENTGVKELFGQLGISRKDNLELRDDGKLFVTKPQEAPAPTAETPEKGKKEEKAEKKDEEEEKIPEPEKVFTESK